MRDASRGRRIGAAVAAVVLLAGLVVGYGQRDGDSPVAALALLGVGTVLAIAVAVLGVLAARRPAGLTWPDGLEGSWPQFPWWWLVGGAGAVDLLAGPLVEGAVGVVGLVLGGAACLGLGRDLYAPTGPVSRAVVRGAERLHAVSHDPASGPEVAVQPIGNQGARVTAFDRTGRLGDVVVRDVATGELAARLAGLPVIDASQLHPPLRTGVTAQRLR